MLKEFGMLFPALRWHKLGSFVPLQVVPVCYGREYSRLFNDAIES
jgi:hypothetical protein